MARILILTDRPEAGDHLVSRTLDLVQRLETGEVSVVVTQREDGFVAAGCTFGVPDSGLLSSDSSSIWVVSPDGRDTANATRFLSCCHQNAADYGIKCETARSNSSFRRTVAVLTHVTGLIVVSREIFAHEYRKRAALHSLWHEVSRPWLICPESAESWKRVVVAIRNNGRRDELISWGRTWSERFNVPLALIELESPPPRSLWKTVSRWLTQRSDHEKREAVCRLLSCKLDPSDLLLVDRDPALWPDSQSGLLVGLDDIVATAPCSVGVAPTSTNADTFELLFPDGLVNLAECNVEVIAA